MQDLQIAIQWIIALPWKGLLDAHVIVEILTFLAEIAVAVVIYVEVEHHREQSFLARAQDSPAREARLLIYQKFFEQPALAVSWEKARKEFGATVRHDKDLRDAADEIIALVNDLGFTANRLWARKTYLRLFPSGPVFVWFALGEYVLMRRADSSKWFVQNMLKFTSRCLAEVRREKRSLIFRSPAGEPEYELTPIILAKLQNEIDVLP